MMLKPVRFFKTVDDINHILHISQIKLFIASTDMCLLYGICIVLNSVPLSLDMTVNGPRP